MRNRINGRAEKRAAGVLAALIFMATVIAGQTLTSSPDRGRVRVAFNGVPPAHPCLLGRVLREIKDPHSKERWLVIRDAQNPAGPGLMNQGKLCASAEQDPPAAAREPSIIIHKGDPVIVEEHTATAEAYLESVALDVAEVGTVFEVRLKIGGKVVKVVAIAAGRAALMQLRGAQP